MKEEDKEDVELTHEEKEQISDQAFKEMEVKLDSIFDQIT